MVVSDSHGNGQNLLLDELPDNVRVVRSWPRPLGMMQGIEEGGFVGACLIGYHAGASNPSGILAHTLYGLVIREVRINGKVIPEAGISAGIAAHFGVPIIMISGNEQATEEFYVHRIGADDFMKKPFARAEVFARIERLMDEGGTPRRINVPANEIG